MNGGVIRELRVSILSARARGENDFGQSDFQGSMSRITFILFTALALTAVLAGLIFWRLHAFNHFSTVENRFAGVCSPVSGVAGPEDVQVDRAAGRVFVSSLDRRSLANDDATRGAIYSIDPNDPLDAAGWTDRTGGEPEQFQPQGLHLYAEGDLRRLFVVNGANNGIEIFDVAPNGDLTHVETLMERRLTSPNDVFAVGPRAFYVTNDTESGRDTWLAKWQFLARVGSGDLFYFGGTSWRLAASELRFANGVAVSEDGARVYVSETAGGALKIFDRDAETGALTVSRSASLPVAPDNITLDADGALWISGSPKPLAIAAHQRDARIRAPSSVVRFIDDAEHSSAEPIFSDRGDLISASTSATRLNDKLVIGALMENKFLLCDL